MPLRTSKHVNLLHARDGRLASKYFQSTLKKKSTCTPMATYDPHTEKDGVLSFQSKPTLNTKEEASPILSIYRGNPL